MKHALLLSGILLLPALSGAAEPTGPDEAAAATEAVAGRAGAAGTQFFVIPVKGAIGKPSVFVVRNGVKEAVAAKADFVVLDMDTPGGDLGSTLEIMEILDRYDGRVVTYVNREAGSAGAIIAAVTDDIYFEPKGVMGAAEPILSTGEDVSEGLKRKMTAYLAAKVDAFSEGRKYRAEVLRAMMDPVYELKIDDEVIKSKDELLMLTAEKAMRPFGDPPRPLLASGIVATLPELYPKLADGAPFEVREFAMTWSIKLAQWLMMISPLLLSVGGLLLFIEFKTPGFGVFGVGGIALILVVFLGHNVAGLSGHEPMLFFLLGAALVLVEMLLFPGLLVPAILGILLMLGSLLWGMADIWPAEAFELSPALFLTPAYNLALGVILAFVFALLLSRFLPKSVFWNRLVLAGSISGTTREATSVARTGPGPGALATVVSDLRPSGRILWEGRHYEARVEFGEVRSGEAVRVVRRADFVYVVEPAGS